MSKVYVSARERLESLPEVFTGGELALISGWSSGIASSYLANWRRAGLIRSVSSRSDVHMNLVRNRDVNPETAVSRAFPLAVKVGVDVLRAAGLTTQIQSFSEIAVPAGINLVAIAGFEMSSRSAHWFNQVETEEAADGLPRLLPEWAFVDMLHRSLDKRVKGAFLLAPDDIDLDAIATLPRIDAAMTAMGLPIDCLEYSVYEGAYEDFSGRGQSRVLRER